MHTIEIHVFLAKYSHTQTHTQTRDTWCKLMCRCTGQQKTHTQTQNTSTDTPATTDTNMLTHTVRPSSTQKHEHTQGQTEPCVCVWRGCTCTYMSCKGANWCCRPEGNEKWVRRGTKGRRGDIVGHACPRGPPKGKNEHHQEPPQDNKNSTSNTTTTYNTRTNHTQVETTKRVDQKGVRSSTTWLKQHSMNTATKRHEQISAWMTKKKLKISKKKQGGKVSTKPLHLRSVNTSTAACLDDLKLRHGSNRPANESTNDNR